MHGARSSTGYIAFIAVGWLGLTSCDSDRGSLRVTTVTGGEVELALGGYTVTVDDTLSQPIEPNGTVVFTDLVTNVHRLALSSLSVDCVSADGTERFVSLLGRATVEETLAITCEAVVFRSGVLNVPLDRGPDLDHGTSDAAGSLPDIHFDTVATQRVLEVARGGAMLRFGRSPPGKGGCITSELTAFPFSYPVEELPAGTFLCVLTGQGRLSEVEIVQDAPPVGGGLWTMAFRTFR